MIPTCLDREEEHVKGNGTNLSCQGSLQDSKVVHNNKLEISVDLVSST